MFLLGIVIVCDNLFFRCLLLESFLYIKLTLKEECFIVIKDYFIFFGDEPVMLIYDCFLYILMKSSVFPTIDLPIILPILSYCGPCAYCI